MIFRLTYRLTLTITSLLAATAIFLVALPFAEPATLELLLGDACAPPCILGIRPGETSIDTALVVLEAHPQVLSVSKAEDNTFALGGRVAFELENVDEVHGELQFDGAGIVQRVTVPQLMTIGGIRLVLGPPDSQHYAISRECTRQRCHFSDVLMTDRYDALNLRIIYSLDCPVHRRTNLLFAKPVLVFVFSPQYRLPLPQPLPTPRVNVPGCSF